MSEHPQPIPKGVPRISSRNDSSRALERAARTHLASSAPQLSMAAVADSYQHQHHHHHHRYANPTGGATTKGHNIIAGHYQIAQKIGEGSFGIIFKGYDLLQDNQPVAIKFESRKSEAPQLKSEFVAYKILNNAIKYSQNEEASEQKFLSVKGIPKVYYFGQEGYYNILIIQLLGPSLEDLFEWCGRRFSIKTVAQCAKQMISRIQFVHENDLIYRDIKPDNFLVGATCEDNTIYLVDFGMIKQYRNHITKQHIPYREHKSLSGTARYMSINTHLGREQSRRDDLESLGHVFIYFLKGQLPWQGLKAPTNKLKYEKIGRKKRLTSIQQLCDHLPRQFADYLSYVRNLKFEEEPDYKYLVSLMDSALESIGEKDDGVYDWMKLNNGKGWDWSKNKKINLNGYGSNNYKPQHRSTRAIPPVQSNNQGSEPQFGRFGGKYGSDAYGKISESTGLTGQAYNSYGSYGQQYHQSGEDDESNGGIFSFLKYCCCCCCSGSNA
ncbi:hypothetical protein HII13_004377 [Brettanomyces bruxellensis]|uniref:non-specific serine/threonine protein kinase n=2 Tax=Dekkera bruxellensis TaxID=5007 RepID=A0A8H6B9T4_DEKBR|nr:uncharacterized protein BRETT_004185 [Brettanomyces bruxellensis]KAF6007706.1 hypothetical protein HII13_004377 [Brettanomyces bruxellensis]KAF6009656.1 hypothetical protein HII12_003202 [Brettanomyces bruxellensis]QOU18964.1 hypothetical protein BRETT_004185 [Brettanomyces bruxellensis]